MIYFSHSHFVNLPCPKRMLELCTAIWLGSNNFGSTVMTAREVQQQAQQESLEEQEQTLFKDLRH